MLLMQNYPQRGATCKHSGLKDQGPHRKIHQTTHGAASRCYAAPDKRQRNAALRSITHGYKRRTSISLKQYLHERKLQTLTLAMSCRLKGPVTCSSWPMAWTISLICSVVFWLMSWGGVTSVASPEWTPAFSTCSDTAIAITTPSHATASTSISCNTKINKNQFIHLIRHIPTFRTLCYFSKHVLNL